jgi:hypothetical protein
MEQGLGRFNSVDADRRVDFLSEEFCELVSYEPFLCKTAAFTNSTLALYLCSRLERIYKEEENIHTHSKCFLLLLSEDQPKKALIIPHQIWK